MEMARLTRNPLARIRIEAGFDTAQVAATALDISRVHLLNVERGRAGASPRLISSMASAYGVEPQLIIDAIRHSRRDLLKRMMEVA